MVENQRVSLGLYTPVNIAGWKMDLDWVDVFPIEDGAFPLLC